VQNVRLSLTNISIGLPINSYLAYMIGGLLKNMGIRVANEYVDGVNQREISSSGYRIGRFFVLFLNAW